MGILSPLRMLWKEAMPGAISGTIADNEQRLADLSNQILKLSGQEGPEQAKPSYIKTAFTHLFNDAQNTKMGEQGANVLALERAMNKLDHQGEGNKGVEGGKWFFDQSRSALTIQERLDAVEKRIENYQALQNPRQAAAPVPGGLKS